MDTIVAVERKSKDFVAFCLAFLLSAFGYEFLFFIMTIRVYGLTNKAMQVGIFAALTFFPKIFSPYYYVVVDRFDPRNVLAFDALAIFALTIAIGSMNDIVAIYVLWTILSVFVMCLSNARTVLMTQVFSRGDIVRGNSLVLSFLNVARLLTPLAAGFLSRFLVFKTIVLISSLIYLGCGVASMLLESRRREGGNHRCVGKAMAQVREGFRFIWSAKSIRAMAEIGIVWRLFLGMQAGILVVYVMKNLRGSSASYGIAMAVVALGSLVGSVAGPYAIRRFRLGSIALTGLALNFLAFVLLATIGDFHFAVVVLGVAYLVIYVALVALHTLRDRGTDPAVRGKVYGSITSILTPPAMISMILGGILADRFGVAAVFGAFGACALIGLAVIELDYRQDEGALLGNGRARKE